MSKDIRYIAVKSSLEAGNINSFRDIFFILPKRIMAKDLHCHYYTLARRINDPKKFTIRNIVDMAALIDTSAAPIFEKILVELAQDPAD